MGGPDPTSHPSLLPAELESNPGISVNSSSVVEYMDSMAAFCHTDAANVDWYVNALLVTSNDRMTISPDGKMLVIHRVGRDDRVLQCAIKNIFGLLQRSEQISLTVACEWSGVTGVEPGVGPESSRGVGVTHAEPERGGILSQPAASLIWARSPALAIWLFGPGTCPNPCFSD